MWRPVRTRPVAINGGRRDRTTQTTRCETVSCPPGEEHWHGALEDRFVEHLAIWEGDHSDTPETTWLEEVTDEQYTAPRTHRA